VTVLGAILRKLATRGPAQNLIKNDLKEEGSATRGGWLEILPKVEGETDKGVPPIKKKGPL